MTRRFKPLATDRHPNDVDPSTTRPVLRFDAAASAPDLDVAAARAGDVAAFERLYHRHAGKIYALCLRMTGDGEEAKELAQEAFVRAWRKLDAFDGRSAFGSWLHRLTVNVVLGRWRAAGRYRERVVAMDDAPGMREPEQRETPGAGVDLERAIARLPKGARTVFVLHDVEGYRHKDIAELTGLAVGTSKTQLHRARRLLREALGHG
ncbi:MAG: RNA polymerase sigma factor [Acidobacteriota bacterium]